jgi:hypothetical protein
VNRSQHRRQGSWVEVREDALGFVDSPDKKEISNLEITRVGSIYRVAMCLQRRSRRVKRPRWPAQVARDERDLGLGNDAPRAVHSLFRPKGARGTPQERLRSNEIPQLRHCNASKRPSRRIVAQGNSLQGTERITSRK